jgi:ATP-binding cassette subfamily B (MDR/TAP) protein 1
VGPSGGGKSTCVGLVERFYDPDEGKVYFDGCDIRDMDVCVLRSKIGLVGQEPVLFNKTIGENIAMGFDGATEDQIIEVRK